MRAEDNRRLEGVTMNTMTQVACAQVLIAGLAADRRAPVLADEPTTSGVGQKLRSETPDPRFTLARNTSNGLSSASEGKIDYVLSTARFDAGARMFAFDPSTGRIRDLGDMISFASSQLREAILHGQSAVN
jgi:hypothetical protein